MARRGSRSAWLDKLPIGNLDAERDWGFAGDYVDAMWRMLQRDEPRDYVIGTGIPHSVRDVCRVAFERVDLDWESHVEVDPARFRPAEVDHLTADYSRAREDLQWEPAVQFEDLVRMMVDADVRRLKGEVVTA